MLGLYLHVPFCTAICGYCNFNRGLLDANLKSKYVAALEAEIRRTADGAPADSIYFGGGTPSLLEPAEIAALIRACAESYALARDTEVTVEMNPETAGEARLAGFLEAGVNRLSIGVQSFDDGELRRLGRVHDAARAVEALRLARAAGFLNVSLDLMMWLPGQTVNGWLANVDRLIEQAPDHASLYLLEVYPNAPLKEDMARAGWSQAPDDDAADMYLQGMAGLEAAGYELYEISNVARPGRECRHNLKYWSGGEWMAFGCGAHGTRAGTRWRNVSSTADYIARIGAGQPAAAETYVLTPQEQAEEAVFMGLRLTKGLRVDDIRTRYGLDVWARYGRAFQPFVESGHLEYTPPVLRLTRQGILLANEVCGVVV